MGWRLEAISKWCTLVHPGENDVRKIQNYRAQPTASDSSDQLFFIRKMRCEGTLLVCNFLQHRYAAAGATRPMHACSRSSRGGEKMGSNPHFGANLGFFGPRNRRMFPRAQHWPFKTPFALWCLPLAPYTQALVWYPKSHTTLGRPIDR